ncbi:MAG TPA: hypothetical protein VFW94_02025, partial [Candidatus Acidoferrales bacterium]|nr:hypothetical protein [Candidatus Acidoferrales bacterium]
QQQYSAALAFAELHGLIGSDRSFRIGLYICHAITLPATRIELLITGKGVYHFWRQAPDEGHRTRRGISK